MRILNFLIFLTFSSSLLAADLVTLQQPEWLNQLHVYLANPNIIYLLLLIAIYGLFVEMANPGMILPGVTGALSLLLVLYAFHLIPFNYFGLMLILFGIGFMIAEVYITSFGIIGLGGVLAFIIGSVMLFNTEGSTQQIAWPLIFMMSIVSFTLIFIILSLVIKSHKRKIVSGREGLIGSKGEVLSMMNEQTVVRVMGEIWDAKSSHPLNPGDEIKVTDVHGLVLVVEPLPKRKGE